MKTLLKLFVIVLLPFYLMSCGMSKRERQQWNTIDSLQTENIKISMDYADLQEYLRVIAEGLDSISIEERELLINVTPGENLGMNRQRMKQKLNHVREILSRHRERIATLEARLNSENMELKSLRTIITTLRQQLDEKDRELDKLRLDLNNSRKSLAELTEQVQKISEENLAQSQTIQEQQETIEKQADVINLGYVKIATKKELKDIGLLTGGFLKKKRIDYSNIDKSKFNEVDIRSFTSIDIPKKAKVLSNVPSGSYKIENGTTGDVIQILDVDKFWSVSHFLIIQTD